MIMNIVQMVLDETMCAIIYIGITNILQSNQ